MDPERQNEENHPKNGEHHPNNAENSEENHKKVLIKRFVIAISRPLSTEENLSLIEGVLSDLKPFKLDAVDYGYLWTGIFYAIWYAEMGKGCEQIVERLYELANAKLIVHGFDKMNKDWFSIDYIRIDKYMYLTRRLTHRLLVLYFGQFVKWYRSSRVKTAGESNVINESKATKNVTNKPDKTNKSKVSNKRDKTNKTNATNEPDASESKPAGRCPNLLKNALDRMSGVGLVDHFLDILYAECFKIIAPFLGNAKQSKTLAAFLCRINKTLVSRLAKSSKDERIQAILKNEFSGLFNHLKRNKFVLERVMSDLIALCNASARRELRSIGAGLEKRFGELLPVRSEQPEILPAKAKLTYNRKKAMKNKRKRLLNKRRKLREENERKLIEEQSAITEITPEQQFNQLVGID